jgi:hypothetical protein
VRRGAAGRGARGTGGAAGGKARGAGRKLAGAGRGARLPSMWSLLKAAVLLGAVAAALFLLPFGGRTLADRWRAADGAGDFASRTWAEMRGARAPEKAPSRKPGPRAQARAGEKAKAAPPEEGVTEAERAQLERLLGDHLADAPRR